MTAGEPVRRTPSVLAEVGDLHVLPEPGDPLLRIPSRRSPYIEELERQILA